MWKYVKRYFHFGVFSALFMAGEVLMDLIQPGLMSWIVDDGVLGANNNGVGNPHLILTLGLAMVGLVIFGGGCGALSNAFLHMTAQNIGNEIRKDGFRRIMTFSFPQVDRFGTGSLVTRVTNDITQIQNLVAQFIRSIVRITMLTAGSIFFMFRLNRQFGLITLGSVPFILICMFFCLWKAYPLLPKLQAQLDQINAVMQEDVSGIRIIKACVRERYEKLRFGKANDEQIQTQLGVLVIFAFMNPIINAILYVVVVLILLSGSYQVKSGSTTPGTIMAAITYTTQLLSGILMLVMLFQDISKGLASWKRLKEVLDSRPDLEDGAYAGEAHRGGRVEFRNVSFGFPGSGQTVLKDINLTIEPGETVAIMGATGCGKTALVNLIPRFYDVTSGEVLVDGVNVKQYEQKALREKIAVTLQKSELFSRTIRENISWGAPVASDEQISAAADIAQASDFIKTTPEGYQTLVAERGMSLSGGQKQRISISRAVVKDSEILIFDDSTSALDLKTEAKLYEALNKARPECTKILVAQRIASVRRADKIVVLSNGRVEACGSHEELMRSSKTYQDIYHSQMGKGEESHE